MIYGKQIYFSEVKRFDYEDSLAVTNLDDMPDYIDLLTNLSNVAAVGRSALKEVLLKEMQDGVLHVPKEYGMFACRK